MSTAPSQDVVATFYDANISGKLKGFVEGNPRVDRAWETIDNWAPENSHRILEIGCGIGDICWRMSRRWPASQVVGLDISRKSIEIAGQLFGAPRVSFVEGTLDIGTLSGKFDLVVLMDVYEHVTVADRRELHQALRELRSDSGRIVLSFPTPRYQAWLRQDHPDQIQPVDEDVSIETISALARDTKTDVLLFQEVNVWHEGDYSHAVLGRHDGWVASTSTPPATMGIKKTIQKLLLPDKVERLVPPRPQRLALLYQKLGRQSYPG